MSVANQLGLADPDSDLLGLAQTRWPDWATDDARLKVVDDLVDLPRWLAAAGPVRADEVLLVLAELASRSGGDDVAAAGALVWVLLPGATLLAHRLRTLTHRIDEVVAAQLWVEARTFPWWRGRKVAANVLMNTRKGVLRDLDVGGYVNRSDPTWFRAALLPPTAELWQEIERDEHVDEQDSAEELVEVLSWAMRAGIVTSDDCRLLLCLAEEADRLGGARVRRGWFGLMSPAANHAVGRQWGLSDRTVARRARRSLERLNAACAQDQLSA